MYHSKLDFHPQRVDEKISAFCNKAPKSNVDDDDVDNAPEVVAEVHVHHADAQILVDQPAPAVDDESDHDDCVASSVAREYG